MKQDDARRKLKAHQANKPSVPQIHITKQGYFTVKTKRRNIDLDGIHRSNEKLKGKQFKRRHKPNSIGNEDDMNLQSNSVDRDNIEQVNEITQKTTEGIKIDVGHRDIENYEKRDAATIEHVEGEENLSNIQLPDVTFKMKH